MAVASVFFMVDRIKKRLPCVSICKGSLLFSKSVGKFIFFRHHRHCDRRRWNCGCCLSCGCSSLNLSYGFHRCSCCPNCGLSLTKSFSMMRNCFCCSYRSTRSFSKVSCFCCRNRLKNSSCCFCCSCRCSSLRRKNSWKRTSFADVRIRSWNATGGCCWARCSFGARCFGCRCARYSSWTDAAGQRCCRCGCWCLPRDGWCLKACCSP